MKKFDGDAPNWFYSKDYSVYKKFESKELCTEMENRRLLIKFIKDEIYISRHYIDQLKKHLGIDDIPKIKSKLLDVLFDINRNDFYFNSYNYNLCNNEIIFITLGNILAENSKIIYRNKLNSGTVKKILISDIYDNFTVPKDIALIYEIYTYNHGTNFEGDIDNSELSEVIKEFLLYRKVENPELVYEHDFKNSSDDGYSDYVNYSFTEKLLPVYNHFLGDLSAEKAILKYKKLFKNSPYEDQLPKSSNSNLFLNIDVSAPDETIVKQTLALVKAKRNKKLNKYRGLLNLKFDNKKNGGQRLIKTVIEQRIFQYIDLMIWNLENNHIVTSDWYIHKIFKDKVDKGISLQHSKMNDTIKPTSKKWLDQDWLNSFSHSSILSYNDFNNK